MYLGKQQIAETSTAGGTQYVHTDALGSPVAHTNTAGQILNQPSSRAVCAVTIPLRAYSANVS